MTVDQIRQRLEGVEQRRRYYEWKSEQPGRLSRHEVWRHAYLARPYLVGAPDDRAAERLCNIFMNVMELGKEGKITPVPICETDEYIQIFTHMLEEYGSRTGGLPPHELIGRARAPMNVQARADQFGLEARGVGGVREQRGHVGEQVHPERQRLVAMSKNHPELRTPIECTATYDRGRTTWPESAYRYAVSLIIRPRLRLACQLERLSPPRSAWALARSRHSRYRSP